jgi:hypothetical protein
MLLGDVDERVKLLRQCNQSKILDRSWKSYVTFFVSFNRITGLCYGSYTWS